MSFGIDVSHHQRSAAVPWEHIAQTSRYAICRANYGARLRDREVVQHVRAARRAGMAVGLYVFWRDVHSNDDQLALFRAVADAVGYGEGDIVPALDIEHDPLPAPGRDVTPEWSGPCEEFAGSLAELYGNVLIYLTRREWVQLGSPQWVLDYPLWTAHYRDGAPATPGDKPCVMHQHRVGPYDPKGPGGKFAAPGKLILDQNRVLGELPLVGSEAPTPIALPAEPPATPHYLPLEPDWQELRMARDTEVMGDD